MQTKFFLGANSGRGFVSLYQGFVAAPGDRLHVIKGGPGTGKSGFMRRIAESAEKRGLDTELVLCSGDPDSLDGVYIPALRQGWADGTAPHVLDPAIFGVAGDYVNLGRFCRLPLSEADAARAQRLTTAYRERYREAYACLAAASSLQQAVPSLWSGAVRERAQNRITALLHRHAAGGGGHVTRRFLSAVSCQGLLRLGEEAAKLCPTAIELEDGFGLASPALRFAEAECAHLGLDRVLCPSPLDPDALDALLLPDAGLALLRGEWGLPGARHLRLDALVESETRTSLRAPTRRFRRLSQEALDEGLEKLRQAKALHDELEAVYRPYMDFAALTAFTEQEVSRIFA